MDEIQTKLAQANLAMRETTAKLLQLGRESERRRKEIRENRDLTHEAREIELRKLKEQMEPKRRSLTEQRAKAEQQFERYRRHALNWRASSVDEKALGRVRSLLDKGHTPQQILDKAVELRDDEAVAALQAELHWFGDGKRFADTRQIVTACDRALAEFGLTTGAGYSQEIVNADEAQRGFPEASEFAMATLHGTPGDVADARIKVGLAANEGQRVLDAEARGRQRAGEESRDAGR